MSFTIVRDTQTAQHGLSKIVELIQAVEKDPNSVISRGSEGITAYYKLLESLRNLSDVHQAVRLEEIKKKALEKLKKTPYRGRAKIYEGDLSADVRKYVTTRTKQQEFSVAEVAEAVDMRRKSAPVYQILTTIPYLRKTKRDGKRVFVRKSR